jgi:hypothetical protein
MLDASDEPRRAAGGSASIATVDDDRLSDMRGATARPMG